MESFFLTVSKGNKEGKNLIIKMNGNKIKLINENKDGSILLDNIYISENESSESGEMFLEKIQILQKEMDSCLNLRINLKKKSDQVFKIISNMLMSDNFSFNEEINIEDFYSLSVDHTSMHSIMESSEIENSNVKKKILYFFIYIFFFFF